MERLQFSLVAALKVALKPSAVLRLVYSTSIFESVRWAISARHRTTCVRSGHFPVSSIQAFATPEQMCTRQTESRTEESLNFALHVTRNP